MDLIYRSVRSSSRRGGYGVNGEYHFIRVHRNILRLPINDKSILIIQFIQEIIKEKLLLLLIYCGVISCGYQLIMQFSFFIYNIFI